MARLDDSELARAAWRAFDAAGEFLAQGDFRVSTNAAAQFALAAIQNLAFAGHAIDERVRRSSDRDDAAAE